MNRLARTLLVLALTALAGCAPLVQSAGRPDLTFTGPRFEAETLVAHDGVRLHLTRWAPPAGEEPAVVVVALHGWNSHAGAFHLAAPWWAERGVLTLAFDQRGFGRSPGRGVWGGELLMTEDLRTAVALARRDYPRSRVVVAAVSMGAALAIRAFASDRPPAADALLVFSPGVWGWSTQSPANRLALRSLAHTVRGVRMTPPGWLVGRMQPTDNEAEFAAAGHDPLVIWNMRPDAVYGLVTLMEGASRDMNGPRVPFAVFYGAHDRVMPEHSMRAAVARLRPEARTAYYADGWHQLLLDLQAEVVWRDALSFMRDPASPWPSGAPPIPGRSACDATARPC